MICPICKYKGEMPVFREKDEYHPVISWMCPQCKSKNQHRLMWLVWEKIKDSFVHNKILHISPMRCLYEKWQNEGDYTSIDLEPRESKSGVAKAHAKMDLTNTLFEDNYFQFIVCSHVLDQIEKDNLALSELNRILSKGGRLFIVNSIFGDKTVKTTKKEKINKRFDKQWKYGFDFFETLQRCGFNVEIFPYTKIEDWEKYGIKGEYLAICQ